MTAYKPPAAAIGGNATHPKSIAGTPLTSALLANVLGIDTLLILTAIAKVAIDFSKPSQDCSTA